MRPIVYGCRGELKIVKTSASSTTRPGVHHDDPVGELRDEPKVVRDQDGRGMRLLLRRAHHLDDLRLNGHVESRCRLVGDQHRRIVRDRHRHHRSLAHAPGELVRILLDATLRERHAHEVEQLDRALARLIVTDAGIVRRDRLGDLVTDREHGIERRHRILEDHRNLPTADLLQLLLRHGQEIATLVERLSAHDPPRRHRDQPEHRHDRDALSRTRLADDTECLTRA